MESKLFIAGCGTPVERKYLARFSPHVKQGMSQLAGMRADCHEKVANAGLALSLMLVLGHPLVQFFQESIHGVSNHIDRALDNELAL